MVRQSDVRGLAAIWVIVIVAGVSVVGAKLWSDAKKRQREEIAALEQKRQTTATIDRERRDFEAKVAAEKGKSEYAKSTDALREARGKWTDAMKIAGATSRVALAGPVSTLQTIRRQTDALILPECLAASRTKLVSGMQTQIDGYLTFMANPGDIGALLSRAKIEEGEKLVLESAADADRCGPPVT